MIGGWPHPWIAWLGIALISFAVVGPVVAAVIVSVRNGREGREVWRRLEEEQRTRVVGQIAVTFPPGTPPAEIDGWEATYRGRVPEPWFGPEDVL